MDKIQSKLFKGANTVQEGLKKGKEKFETSQELNELKGELRILQQKRTNHMLGLGEDAYGKHRQGQDITLQFVDEIKMLDKSIFDILKIIQEKTNTQDERFCECGNTVTLNDKFCKECGKKTEVIKEVDINDMVECHICSTYNLKNNNYCNCCGSKLV